MSLLHTINDALNANPEIVVVEVLKDTLERKLKEIQRIDQEIKGDSLTPEALKDLEYSRSCLIRRIHASYFIEGWDFKIAPLREMYDAEELQRFMESLFPGMKPTCHKNSFDSDGIPGFPYHIKGLNCGFLAFMESIGKIPSIELTISDSDTIEQASLTDSQIKLSSDEDLIRLVTVRPYPNIALAIALSSCYIQSVYIGHNYISSVRNPNIRVQTIPPEALKFYKGAKINFLYNKSEPGIRIRRKCKSIEVNPLIHMHSGKNILSDEPEVAKLMGIDKQEIDRPTDYLAKKLSAWVERAKSSK